MDDERPLFDRRVPDALVDVLRPGGRLSALTRLADQDSRLDLQLRANPKKPREGWATLYVGLTKAFDLYGTDDGRLKLAPQGRFALRLKEEAAERGWTVWRAIEELEPSALVDWIGRVIDEAPSSKADNEGIIQAVVGRGVPDWFATIDREGMLAFSTDAARDATLTRIRAPLERAAKEVHAEGGGWRATPARPGSKLDALCVDKAGRVLVVEVKPGAETGTLAWTPLQVATYTALFRDWAASEEEPSRILNGMIEQREALELIEPGRFRVSAPVRFAPVIAVGTPVPSPVVDERMRIVHDAVRAVEPALLDGLEIWTVSKSGEIVSGELGRLQQAESGEGHGEDEE